MSKAFYLVLMICNLLPILSELISKKVFLSNLLEWGVFNQYECIDIEEYTRGIVWSPNSALKSAFFSTFKSAFTQKSAFKSAIKSAQNSNSLLKVPIIVLLKVPIIVTSYKKCQK